ncbi:MAG: T9SS type A sorting domain-containing protein [Bacteroidota bacterium]
MRPCLRDAKIALLLLGWFIGGGHLSAQTFFHYPLTNNFNEATNSGPPLVAWANDLGDTGVFTARSMPANACGGAGVLEGYEYDNNAGLGFYYPVGMAGCEYTIQWTWIYDEMNSWVRILSFLYADESGLEIRPNTFGVDGTFYVWYLAPFLPGLCIPVFGPLGSTGNARVAEVYQMALTRTCNDEVNLYANGVLQGSFIDVDAKYYPQGAIPKLVMFRDTLDLSCYPTPFPNEASPGFIQDLIIGDTAMSATAVADSWNNFCPTVLVSDTVSAPDFLEAPIASTLLRQNPVKEHLHLELSSLEGQVEIRIYDALGKQGYAGSTLPGPWKLSLASWPEGTYLLRVWDQKGQHHTERFVLRQ